MADFGSQNGNYEYQKGDALLIPALASGQSIKDAAKLAGIGERTAARRLDDAAFRHEVQRVQGELVDKATGLLSEAAADAATKLKDLLKAESENVQLGAAKALLDYNLKLREHSELERLKAEVEELKARVKEVKR